MLGIPLRLRAIALLLLFATAAGAPACSSSTSAGAVDDSGAGSDAGGSDIPDGATSVGCQLTPTGVTTCYEYSGLTSAQLSSTIATCKAEGHVVSVCPAAGQVGCCAYTSQAVNVNQCFYCGDASSYQTTCAKVVGSTWTPGAGGPTSCE